MKDISLRRMICIVTTKKHKHVSFQWSKHLPGHDSMVTYLGSFVKGYDHLHGMINVDEMEIASELIHYSDTLYSMQETLHVHLCFCPFLDDPPTN